MSYNDVSTRAKALRRVVELIREASETLISEWMSPSADAVAATETGIALLGRGAYDARRNIIAALGSVEELVAEPHFRLMDFSYSYLEARVLHVALENDVASLLARGGEDGVPVEDLAKATGIDASKLGEQRQTTADHALSFV